MRFEDILGTRRSFTLNVSFDSDLRPGPGTTYQPPCSFMGGLAQLTILLLLQSLYTCGLLAPF